MNFRILIMGFMAAGYCGGVTLPEDSKHNEGQMSCWDSMVYAWTGEYKKPITQESAHLSTYQRHFFKLILPALIFIGFNAVVVFLWGVLDFFYMNIGKYSAWMAMIFPDSHSNSCVIGGIHVYINNTQHICAMNSTGYIVCQRV